MSTHDRPDHDRPVRTDPPASRTGAGADVTSRMTGTYREEGHAVEGRPTDRSHGVLAPKTSAAAVFSLVFGLAALFSALTAILAPAAVLFGIIGLIVAAAGFKMTKRPGVTGRGTTIGGLVTSLLGLLLGAAVLIGAAVVVNDEQQLDRIQNQVENLRNDLPSTQEIRDELPG
jgi:hypothetical protein